MKKPLVLGLVAALAFLGWLFADDGLLQPAAGTSGSGATAASVTNAISTISSNGVQVATGVTNIDFKGAFGTVSNLNGNVTVNAGGGSGTPGGADQQVQFNDAGAFGGDAGLTYNKTDNLLTNENGIYINNGPVIPFAGSEAVPSFAFKSDLDSGFYSVSGGNIGVSVNGALEYNFGANGFDLYGANSVGFASNNVSQPDVFLYRYAPRTLIVSGNGSTSTNGALFVNGTDDTSGNAEIGKFQWIGNELVVGTTNTGTGTLRRMRFVGSDIVVVPNITIPGTTTNGTTRTTNLVVVGGTLGASKVLTDVNGDGIATWQAAAAGGGSGTNTASFGITNFFRYFAQTNSLAGAGTTNLVIDGNQAALVRCTVTAAFGVLFTNLIDGQEGRIEVKQDSTGIRTGAVPYSNGGGGAFTNTYFGTEISWPLTFSTNANYVDQLKWVCRGTNVVIVGFTTGYPVP